MKYGAETWILTAALILKFKLLSKLWNELFSKFLMDKIRNEDILNKSKATDIARKVSTMKLQRAGSVCRRTDGLGANEI